jgi:ribosomal protein S18 acetylase RimI-like enzyme
MRIREATAADSPQLARVYVDGWRFTYRGLVPDVVLNGLSYERREQFWRKRLISPGQGDYTYVAEDEDDNVVGIVHGGRDNPGDQIYLGVIRAIYIDPAHQRRGIGRRLMAAAADHLAGAGITSLSLEVFKGNPAYDFYLKLGGAPIGEHVQDIATIVPDISEPVLVPKIRIGWTDTRPLRSSSSSKAPLGS